MLGALAPPHLKHPKEEQLVRQTDRQAVISRGQFTLLRLQCHEDPSLAQLQAKPPCPPVSALGPPLQRHEALGSVGFAG